jgi:hypothetical protein
VADEALGVGVVGGGQDVCSLSADFPGTSVVDVGGGAGAETAVAVVVVIPGEEVLAVCSCVLDRGEPGREVRPVFEGLELRF